MDINTKEPIMTKSQQITLSAMKLADEAEGQVAARTADSIFKAAKLISRNITSLNCLRSLRQLEEQGKVKQVTVEGMGGRLTLWIRKEQ